MRAALRRPSTLFAVSALLVVAACVAVVRSRAFVQQPEVAAWGVTFDLTVSIPLLYWFFIVRTGNARPLTIAPLFLAGTLVASLLVPQDEQQFLRQLRAIGVPLAEVLLLAALVRRVAATRELSARTLLGDGRVAEIVASEMAVLYYAVFGWRAKPEETRGTVVTFHERAGWGSVLACIFVVLAAEGVGMHLLLSRWSSVAAWTWTALDVWGALWLLGDYHALRLRRSFIDDDALHLRYGLRWSAVIPLAQIASVDEIRAESEWKRKDVLKVAMLEEPRWLVTLSEAVVVRGLAGLRKEVRALALLPDDEESLRRALSAAPRVPCPDEPPSALR